MGCGCLSAGLHACTTTPITERKQLKLISETKLNAYAAKAYELSLIHISEPTRPY